MPDLSWMKEFLPEDSYDRVYSKIKNTYDTVHSPNIVNKLIKKKIFNKTNIFIFHQGFDFKSIRKFEEYGFKLFRKS